MMNGPRSHWLLFSLLSTLLTLLLHVVVLIANGQNPISSPISTLSRGDLGALQTLALTLFGCAHLALALALGGLDRGRLWPFARGLLLAGGIGQMLIAYYFMNASEATLFGPDANDPLWVLASITGLAMGALQPGLSRLSKGLGLFSGVALGVWLWLVPLILLVNEHWLGLYERIVGAIYIVWMLGVAFALRRVVRSGGFHTKEIDVSHIP